MDLLGVALDSALLNLMVVRRLFSTFAHGAPGAGLLLLRIVTGLMLILDGCAALRHGPAAGQVLLCIFAVAVGLLLLLGLWTPVAGILLAIVASWYAFTQADQHSSGVLLASLGVGLALLGPGGWSVDAHLFGWKRVELPDRKS